MGRKVDLTGQAFGRLRVTSLARKGVRGRTYWACRCECGGSAEVQAQDLLSGATRSCGCLLRERAGTLNKSHGMSKTKTYRIWAGMVSRCRTATASGYKEYGGRGITVCDRWLAFENFLADMGECPSDASIERVDVNGNYTPENCVWIKRTHQARNTSRTRRLGGSDGRSAAAIAAENGISNAAYKARLYKYGWSVEEACGAVPRSKTK